MTRLIASLIIFIVSMCVFACTNNQMAKNSEGTKEYQLEPNSQLIQVSWKQNHLWILTAEADPYFFKPKTYTMSSLGMVEGTILIKESALPDSVVENNREKYPPLNRFE